MGTPRVEKRILCDDSEMKVLEPILVRIEDHDVAPRNIHIDKNEFSIGRGRDNDEIILDTMVSRKHCILRCEGNEEWIIKDTSSTGTFVNGEPVPHGSTKRVAVGDIVQFSIHKEFRYIFTLDLREEHSSKRPRINEQLLDSVLTEQKTFAANQECQRKVLKDQLQTKQKEQVELKQQLQQLLEQQRSSQEDTDDLKRQILTLEGQIEMGNTQEQHLQKMYAELLKKLEEERVQFEAKLNEEKQKWQVELDMTKQEKEMLEERMKQEMEACREELQTMWKNEMENRVKEEKDIQAQLINEKTVLEQKLKETEKALKEQEAKAETVLSSGEGSAAVAIESCILLEVIDSKDTGNLQVLDTIDLTVPTQAYGEGKEGVLNKVSDIMDEQLTCSVCSELFVKATTLNCTHTFCQHCINSWAKRRKECPVCRACIISMNRSLVLDNFIEKMLENLPTHLKERRQEIIKERKVLEKKKKAC